MEAQKQFFNRIIRNGATQFQVPVFQRDYSWKEENCRQLWNDILKVADAVGDRGHFIGSVVYIQSANNNAGFSRWLLIDGQQRMTTLTLLMVALRDHIERSGWNGEANGLTVRQINSYFLRNMDEVGDRHLKLRLRNHDHETLEALVMGTELPENPSAKIRDNYELFSELIAEEDPLRVYTGVLRLMLVDVSLTRGEDDPQMIFASLNSTGVDLGQADLIRNLILMSLLEPDQTRLYEQYWRRIEGLFRGSERTFDNFIRDYLALRNQSAKLTRSDRVYEAFREEFPTVSNDVNAVEEVLTELLRHARQYAAFAVGGGNNGRSRAFALLRHLGDVPAILIMRLLDIQEIYGSLSEDELLEAIRLIESYLLRRAITGGQNKGYGIEFAKLAYRIDNTRPLASLKSAFYRLPAAYAFPDDTEFTRALTEGDIYHKRVSKHLLDALENRDLEEQADTTTYSIEHIMPQNERLNDAWKSMLGEDWKETQKTWLHRLGNLTLTGYNSTYKDRSLLEKQTVENGFRHSSVRLNQDVAYIAAWTPIEMMARGERLAQRALTVWPSLRADMEMVREMERADLVARAARRDPEQVVMTLETRGLFQCLQNRLKSEFPDVIEMGEARSVSYHDPDFFLEVIPRRRGLSLLLAIEYNEVEGAYDFVEDASQYAFLVNANYQGGVLITLRDMNVIDRAMPVIAQARTLVSGA